MHKRNGRLAAALILLFATLGTTTLATGKAQPMLSDVVAEARLDRNATGLDLDYERLPDPYLDAGGTGTACRGDPFTVQTDGFVFRSGQTDWACGSASWRLPVPAGAERVVVRFRADRSVEAEGGAAVRAVQEFALHAPEQGVLLERALFPSDARSAPQRWFEFPFALAGDVADLLVAWRFEDRGAAVAEPLGAAPAGVAFEAAVDRIEVQFLGVPVPGLAAGEPVVERAENTTVRRQEVRFVLPEAWFGEMVDGDVEVVVLARGGYDEIVLVLPGGTELPNDEVRVDPAEVALARGGEVPEDVCAVRVSAELTSAGGPGNYTLLLRSRAPARELPGGMLLGLGVIAGPSVLLAVAAGSMVKTLAGERHALRRRSLVPFVGVGFGVAVLVALASRGGPVGLSRWPVAPEATAAFVALVVATVLSLVVLAVSHVERDRRRRRTWQRLLRESTLERRSREQAEEALYAVVHDLKTPLIALEYLVEDVRRGDDDAAAWSEETREAVRRTGDVVREMNQLVADMLSFAKEVGDVPGEGEVWVRPAVKEAVENLQGSSVQKGARIVVEPGLDACLLVPPESLRHILENLIDNAIKYGPDVGAVVRVSLRRRGKRSRPHGVVLEIADNGSGIAPEDRERVFKLLTRVPDRQGRPLPGTGIGLAVVQRLVGGHGGTIEVEAAPEGGALFRITWPAAVVRRIATPVEDPGWETRIAGAERPAGPPSAASG